MIIMSKLVQKISWNLNSSGFQKELQTEMYMYDKASFRANKAMQEPLEKLYQYENKPDMREKIREYINELDTEINRLERNLEKQMIFNVDANKVAMTELRMKTLIEVENDLNGRLEEAI